MRTFIESLQKETDYRVPYPADLEQEAGSLAVQYNGALIVLDISTAYTYVARIYLPFHLTGKRRGSDALNWLCTLADKYKVRLRLYAHAKKHKHLDTEDLVSWYRRYGFIKRGVFMVRRPRH